MDSKLYDELGSLLLFSKASKEDVDLLIRLIARNKYSYIDLLRELVKSDTDLIKLLDVMAGVRFQFPERRKIYKTLEKIFIYNFCAKRNFSEESYKIMSKQYRKRVPQVKAIVCTMQKFLDSDDGTVDIMDEIDLDKE